MVLWELNGSFYIMVFFWVADEVAGEKRESKTHGKAHAAPSAAAALVQLAARPLGVATRVALVYVNETPLLQQHEKAMDLGFAPEVPVAAETSKFDDKTLQVFIVDYVLMKTGSRRCVFRAASCRT
jgi:hypothetical protein